MPPKAKLPTVFPVDPLQDLISTADYRRRTISGILESYNSNYDTLAEAVQNAVDALEDAELAGMESPYQLKVMVNLKDNWISVLDSGIGMPADQLRRAFAPAVSFKTDPALIKKRAAKGNYRGYKGASSAEFVGEFRFGEGPECMI